jgi:hypothetical protein
MANVILGLYSSFRETPVKAGMKKRSRPDRQKIFIAHKTKRRIQSKVATKSDGRETAGGKISKTVR